MPAWQGHFLHIVGSTEFLPWDPVFVNQIEFKPIIGLRPFVINGQTTIYKWLRKNGFRTFNHYFPGIELENCAEYEVHDSLIKVLQYLQNLSKAELLNMYRDMWPDLLNNRNRFFEFAQEQQNKILHLFKQTDA